MADADKTLGLPLGTLFNILHSTRSPAAGVVPQGHLRQPAVPSRWPTGDGSWCGRRRRRRTCAMLALIFVSGVVFMVIGTIIFKRLEPAFAKLL